MPTVARIALPRPVRRFFEYRVPPSMSLARGQRVQVPFGNQRLTGLVMELCDHASTDRPLKPVDHALEDWPVLPDQAADLLLWAARFYQHPPGECVFTALPPALRRGAPATRPEHRRWFPVEGAEVAQVPERAKRQRDLLAALLDAPGRTTAELKVAGFNRPLINQLLQRELIEERNALPDLSAATDNDASLSALNTDQQQLVENILSTKSGFAAHLIHGITGSGKTEVYMHCLQAHRRQAPQRQALVLIPEINLTPQTVTRFQRHFGARIAVWHSALNATERLDTWLRIRQGEPVIVVGTRSAVLLPFTDLGLIVVDEEHDSAYKQQEGFRYSARDLAVYRAWQSHCPVILGSATPSLESLHNVHQGRYHLHRLQRRAGNARLPEIRLLDIRSRPLTGGLAPPLLEKLRETLAAGHQALLFINRRGFSPVVMCYDCGTLIDCPSCDARLTYHRRDNCLRCHHCHYQQAIPRACPECRSDNLHPVGLGTERTETALQEQFPETPVLRIDRDSTRRRGSLETHLEQVRSGRPCILVGTQMLAKGHDFPNVTLVGVLNADGGLFSSDFRAPEQLAQLLLQVGGRAGRGDQPGEVVIQTCHSDHPLLNTLARGDYMPVAESLLAERVEAGLPPASFMIALRVDAPTMEASLQVLDDLARHATAAAPDITVLGPFPAVIARKANRHRASVLLQHHERPPLQRLASQLCQLLEQWRLPSKLRWSIDVDPQSID